MLKQTQSKLALIATLFAIFGMVSISSASTSPFAQNSADTTQVTKGDKKKCGEGKCGDKKAAKDKKADKKCGDKKADKKCGDKK